MAKRKNPFGETTPLQLKVHIGVKEAASMADKEKIYAHTRALLFQGANPSASREALREVGGLNGFIQPPKPVKMLQEVPSQPIVCVHCTKPGVALIRCNDCDKHVCSSCARHCCVCNGSYCQLCSVLNYNQSEVLSVCLNCLPVHSS